MENKAFIITLFIVALVTGIIVFGIGYGMQAFNSKVASSTIAMKQVGSTISASGSVHSEQEVTLHFQTGGKLIYLPFKQGDSVSAGQTIAALDTYALQKQLQIQANTYQIAANNNTTTQENNQAGIVEGQTRTSLDTTNHNSYANVTEAQVVTDTVARLVQNSLLTQNSAQLQVDLANYAVQLASLTAPFNGVLLAEDVTTPNINVTPTTGFTIADPSQKVFRAQVDASDIDFVSVGAKAVVTLDGQKNSFTGTITTVYPQKQTLASGEQVYNVDIIADKITTAAFGQNGSVIITSNDQTNAFLVPSWAIVGHTSIWVADGQKAILKKIEIGAIHGAMTEVVSGLNSTDRVILSPENIAKQKYQIL